MMVNPAGDSVRVDDGCMKWGVTEEVDGVVSGDDL
jgi:hypothetical protein